MISPQRPYDLQPETFPGTGTKSLSAGQRRGPATRTGTKFFGREGARGREDLLSTKGFPPPHPVPSNISCYLTDTRQLGAFEHAQQALATDAGT